MDKAIEDWALRSVLRVNTLPKRHVCPPDWSWSGRLHDWNFWCVLQGQGWLRIDAERYDLEPGVCFLLHPGMETEGRHDPAHPLHVFSCHFDLLDEGGASREVDRSPFPRGARKPGNESLLQSLTLQALEWRPNDPLRVAIGENALRSLILYIAEYEKRGYRLASDLRVERVKRAAQADLRQKWTVASMARIAGMSPSHFSRVFKRYEGKSPIEYVMHSRIDEAKRLALSTELSVSEIAEQLGYSDPFFFSRQFRELAGYPPSRIRQANR